MAAQRLGELGLAGRNTKRLLAEGAVEVGGATTTLCSSSCTPAGWRRSRVLPPWTTVPNPWWLALYVLLQFGRLWVIATLGRLLDDADHHPARRAAGDAAVRTASCAIPTTSSRRWRSLVLPLAFGQVWIALVWSVANALLVAWRIRIEDRALQDRRG